MYRDLTDFSFLNAGFLHFIDYHVTVILPAKVKSTGASMPCDETNSLKKSGPQVLRQNHEQQWRTELAQPICQLLVFPSFGLNNAGSWLGRQSFPSLNMSGCDKGGV